MNANQIPNVTFDLGTLEQEARVEFKKIDREKVKGIQHYRILPPYGENANGALSRKYTIHWGLMGENGKQKPVECSYPTEKFCPICQDVREARDELQRMKDTGAPQSKQDELSEYIFKFQAKTFFLYNAVTMDGRVVVLEIPKTAHEELKKKIQDSVYNKNTDPTNLDSGIWFTFNREGKGRDTVYTVDYKRIEVTVDGEILEKIDRTAIPEGLLSKIKAQLAGAAGPMYDVHSFYGHRTAAELDSYLKGKAVPEKVQVADSKSEPEETEDEIPNFSKSSGTLPNVNEEMERLNALQNASKA